MLSALVLVALGVAGCISQPRMRSSRTLLMPASEGW